MASKDYYKSLGIEKGASESDIKSAFRQKARKYHPDVNKDPDAQDKFKEINEAYQVLSNPDSKSKYDQFGTVDGFDFGGGGGGFGGAGGFGDIFSNFGDIFEEFGFGGGLGDIFGQRSGASRGGQSTQRKSRGEDIRADVALTLEEVAEGVEKELDIRHLAECSSCKGSGSKSNKAPTACSTCGGRGEVRQSRQSIMGMISTVTACPTCHGAGKVISDPCTKCSGSGRAAKSKTLKVKIPAGIDQGSKLRVGGEGNVGQNGGPQGDLYVYVDVKRHQNFDRDADDLYSKKVISFSQAALGDEITVETINSSIRLKIPAGTQSHTSFRLKGKGLPRLQRYGHGDQFVNIVVETPKNLSNDEKLILEYLSYIRKEKTGYSVNKNIGSKLKKIFK